MDNILNVPLSNVKSVGVKTLEVLNSMDIYTIKDLLGNIPYRIESVSNLSGNIKDKEKIIAVGKVESRLITQFYGNKRSRSFFSLQSNIGSIKVVIFNQVYLKKIIVEGNILVVKGNYNANTNTITASSISLDKGKEKSVLGDERPKLEMVYHLKKGMTQKKYKKIVDACFSLIHPGRNFVNLVPENFKGIWPLEKIYRSLHYPENIEEYEKAKKMFAFHELFEYQMKLQLKNYQKKKKDYDYSVEFSMDKILEFTSTLPFKLTNSQEKVVREIRDDLSSPYPMYRLLQGDVGSGKTVVAATLIYGIVQAGYQAAIMAPTEILAAQHFETFFNFFKDLNLSIVLITSSTPKKERTRILKLLKEGHIDLLVGTHSLIQKDVAFKNLKFVITDEQHRFGVNQRKSLSEKGEKVNSLMMTATPIPRSLAITLITDIKVSTIDELPSGRKKIETYKASSKQLKMVFDNLIKELDKGRQAYVVCPLIEESEKMDLENVGEMFKKLKSYLPDKYKIEILHGKMKNQEKDDVVERFVKKKSHVLISTTVIEVGVNVPNASFMIIVDANRFGLATLHQLRGRVGRGEYQSYCVLVSDSKTERIDIMCLENDGFKIAEFDLKQRGPGDFFGTKQSGLPSFKVADLLNDVELMYLAKKLATKIIEVTDDKERLQKYVDFSERTY
ncbi:MULTISPECIES: ATP-dependent DNA helicase RecG [unclassified Gemella]|uniref:ATP-dependent DNA helicase RecG n=1 Tax=unclassified Gemella TaxID=2624949 RepID=UPI00107439CE|nr:MULTISPECIES: ATP-dependent DNA helicase RecG [unclassified Gemella]MBF0710229.1 ATP-dependent DNA helicase RecG [Gemella sp. GL1.1]MBF0746529.1 ATP-dependent DNA helicase RecG [Gemella sp. 19428wG2_WT2a]NYS27573.1 ATP-dependent DNA helicase RecG [Gemella sp. GL1]TFU60307.1 ATP-dependent DNA helicase RecG [Gemella sp. WT2a]